MRATLPIQTPLVSATRNEWIVRLAFWICCVLTLSSMLSCLLIESNRFYYTDRYAAAGQLYDMTSGIGWASTVGLIAASVKVRKWSVWLCGFGWTATALWMFYYGVLPRY